MRVIAGTAGGLRIASVPGRGTRPTLDRVRESLFAILTPRLEDARVLDLYAGTGALGIEALSRGAASCDFVEWQREALQVLRQNLETTHLAERARLHRLRLPQGLGELAGDPFDLALVDPPYALSPWSLLWPLLLPRVRPDGLVACEHARAEAPEGTAGFSLWRRQDYGQTSVSFFRRDGG